MLSIFSNRELAFITWIVFFISLFIFRSKKTDSSVSLFEALLNEYIIFVVIFTLAYSLITLSVLVLLNHKLYALSTLKLFIIWFLFTALPSVGNFTKIKDSTSYINSSVRSILSLTIIVDLIHEVSIFNYFIELLLVAVIFFLGFALISEDAEKDNRGLVKKFANYCIGLITIVILINFFLKLVQINRAEDASLIIYDLLITIYLSISFIPVIVVLSKYSRLENVYVTVNHQMEKEEKLTIFEFFYVLFTLNFNITSLERWRNSIAMSGHKPSKGKLYIKISNLLRTIERETSNVEVPLEKGWSSEGARFFLKPIVSEMGFYKEIDNGVWHAGSVCVVIESKSHLENTIAYYIEGNSDLVEQLKVVGNMNSQLEEEEFFELFKKSALKLFEEAFSSSIPNNLLRDLMTLKLFNIKFRGKRVSLTKNTWPTGMGYSLKFIIENSLHPSLQKLLLKAE